MATNAKERVIAAIEKVVQAAKELSQAESEYLETRCARKSGTVRLVCGVAPDDREAGCHDEQ